MKTLNKTDLMDMVKTKAISIDDYKKLFVVEKEDDKEPEEKQAEATEKIAILLHQLCLAMADHHKTEKVGLNQVKEAQEGQNKALLKMAEGMMKHIEGHKFEKKEMGSKKWAFTVSRDNKNLITDITAEKIA